MVALILVLMLVGVPLAGAAPAPATASAPDQPMHTLGALLEDPQVTRLLELLATPDVRERLIRQAAPAGAEARPQVQDRPPSYIEAVRQRILALAAAVPVLSDSLVQAARHLRDEIAATTRRGLVAPLLLLLLAGITAERLFQRAMAGRRGRLEAAAIATIRERITVVLARMAYGLLAVVVFTVASFAALVAFEWPPLLGAVLMDVLIAVAAVRAALAVGRFVLAPEDDRYRLLPISTRAARSGQRWLGAVVGLAAARWVTVSVLARSGAAEPAITLTNAVFAVVVLAGLVHLTWLARRMAAPGSDTRAPLLPSHGAALVPVLATLFFPLLGFLFLTGARAAAWCLIVLATLPAASILARRVSHHLLRTDGTDPAGSSRTHAMVLERGLRAGLVLVAAVALAATFELDLAAIAAGDTLGIRLIHAGAEIALVLLVADLIWQLAKVAIDRRIVAADSADAPSSEDEARKRARLRTLLPILRNMLFIALLTMATLMALAALGVQIGPLLAGAGVVGVAVGFGAQTLVKDVIAGVFFLVDDAFRVGEYIVSGNVKGTVESFSLRSVRLRHHRGPLLTVPFGDIKEITNHSRDWVIEKLQVRVSHDTDLGLLKRIVRQVGTELMQDPELGPSIIAPLKLQGVEEIGRSGIVVRLKVTTRPDEQYQVRNAAFVRLKAAFETNGVGFGTTTVAVISPTAASDPVSAPTRPVREPVLSVATDALPKTSAG